MLSEDPFTALERRLNQIEARQAETLQILRSITPSPLPTQETSITSSEAASLKAKGVDQAVLEWAVDALSTPDVSPADPKETREKIGRLVRSYGTRHREKIAYKTIWTQLYKKLNDEFGFNAFLEQSSSKEPYLDAVERAGELENLYWLAEKYLTNE